MNSSQIKKNIKNLLISNFSGKEFYRVEVNSIKANKFFGDNLNLYKLTAKSSVLNNFEITTKLNSYSKTEINVDIKLFNSDNTVITNLYFSVNKESSEESIVGLATSKINEVFDIDFVNNYVKQANDQYHQAAIYNIEHKMEKYKKEKNTDNFLDLIQLGNLIDYYSTLLIFVKEYYSS